MISRSLKVFSRIIPWAVLFLIFFGALVKSNEAGLSVPDWPLTYGENMFTFHYSKWQGGIFYEHGHRLIASGIGFLTLILCAWLYLIKASRVLQILGLCALATVVIQGVLGGMTVLFGLPAWISAAHAFLAQTFLLITVTIAFLVNRPHSASHFPNAKKFLKLSLIFVGLIYLQLIVGAFMRHTEAGLAMVDFPTMAGKYWPDLSDQGIEDINDTRLQLAMAPLARYQVLLHLGHRLGGFIIFFFSLWFILQVKKSTAPIILKLKSYKIFSFVILQFVLGVVSILSFRDPIFTSIHVVSGALLLAMVWVLALNFYFNQEHSK